MGGEWQRARTAPARTRPQLERQISPAGQAVDPRLSHPDAGQSAMGLRRPDELLGPRARRPVGDAVERDGARRMGDQRRLLQCPAGARVAPGRGYDARPGDRRAQAQALFELVAERGLLQRGIADVARGRHADPRRDEQRQEPRRFRPRLFRRTRRRLGAAGL